MGHRPVGVHAHPPHRPQNLQGVPPSGACLGRWQQGLLRMLRVMSRDLLCLCHGCCNGGMGTQVH